MALSGIADRAFLRWSIDRVHRIPTLSVSTRGCSRLMLASKKNRGAMDGKVRIGLS